MKTFNKISCCILLIFLSSCGVNSKITDADVDQLGITNKTHLSAATQRALRWPKISDKWYIEFGKPKVLKGDLAPEEGVVRRDPSSVLKINDTYYVWYTKGIGTVQGFGGDIEHDKVFPWDRCDVWYATSKDGETWKEQGLAVGRGDKGAYDDRSVFTPEVMEYDKKYYLCYQTVKSPYNIRVKETVGMAWANSPDGPWTKTSRPVLSPANNGIWRGQEDNRFAVTKKGDFDSHKIHDPCIIPYKGKFYLYYKGEQMGEEITWGGRQIRHGVAIADSPLGPYIKSPFNPISNSGHEICVWLYNGGIASALTTDGPERNTLQWAPDGINFQIMAAIKGVPPAIGLYRDNNNANDPVAILQWVLSHELKSKETNYIVKIQSYHRKFK